MTGLMVGSEVPKDLHAGRGLDETPSMQMHYTEASDPILWATDSFHFLAPGAWAVEVWRTDSMWQAFLRLCNGWKKVRCFWCVCMDLLCAV